MYEDEERRTATLKAQEAAAAEKVAAARTASKPSSSTSSTNLNSKNNKKELDPKNAAAAISQSATGRKQRRSLLDEKALSEAEGEDTLYGSGMNGVKTETGLGRFRRRSKAEDQDYEDPDAENSESEAYQKQQEQHRFYGSGSDGDLPYTLTTSCRAFLSVALPGDTMRAMQSSLSSVILAQQLQRMERTLGLNIGTFHDGFDDDASGITLTGWVAVAGALAILVVCGTGMLWMLGRHMGVVGGKRTWVVKDPSHSQFHSQPYSSSYNGQGGAGSSSSSGKNIVDIGIGGSTPIRPSPRR